MNPIHGFGGSLGGGANGGGTLNLNSFPYPGYGEGKSGCGGLAGHVGRGGGMLGELGGV